MNDTISYIFGFIAGAIFMLILCLYLLADTGLAQKCAETQGKYDFCVQKQAGRLRNEKNTF